MTSLTSRRCPACDDAGTSRTFKVRGFDIFRCKRCGTMFVSDVPGEDRVRQIYLDSGYYEMGTYSERRIELENDRRLGNARKYVSNGSVIDVGCATGKFLDAAKRAGFRTFGIELSPTNSEVARSKGHEVFTGDLAQYLDRHGGARFDLIVCLDVIEHVAAPREFLRGIGRLLGQDSVLVLSTPNYSGPIAKLLGARDPFLTPPEHLNFFTRAGVVNMMNHAGMRLFRVETFGTLSDEEIRRGVTKHLPKFVPSRSALLFPLFRFGFKSLNWAKMGLELECYARSNRS